jgi:hypothetical protein
VLSAVNSTMPDILSGKPPIQFQVFIDPNDMLSKEFIICDLCYKAYTLGKERTLSRMVSHGGSLTCGTVQTVLVAKSVTLPAGFILSESSSVNPLLQQGSL